MSNTNVIGFIYQPAKPEKIRSFDYSQLSKSQIFFLHAYALLGNHLTQRQRERLINVRVTSVDKQ